MNENARDQHRLHLMICAGTACVSNKSFKIKDVLEKELEKQKQFLAKIKKKLANRDFLGRAPAEVIDGEKMKQMQAEDRIARLNKNLESISGW